MKIKKYFLLIVFSLLGILMISCKEEPENLETLFLQQEDYCFIEEDDGALVIISDTINLVNQLNTFTFVEIEPGDFDYYLYKITLGEQIIEVVDYDMFKYKDKFYSLRNCSFTFLDDYDYIKPENYRSLKLSLDKNQIEIKKMVSETVEYTIYLNKENKVTDIINALNKLKYIGIDEIKNEQTKYIISAKEYKVEIINETFMRVNNKNYYLLAGSLGVIKSYHEGNADTKINDTGWLGWI